MKVSRRQFIRASTLIAAGAVAAACAPQPTATPPPKVEPTKVPPTTAPKVEPTKAPATAAPTQVFQVAPATTAPTAVPPTVVAGKSKYKEAPELAKLVTDGKLPSVDERVPENPLVTEGEDGIGKYGGTWRRGFSGQADQSNAGQLLQRSLLRINYKLALVPEMAESWQVSADATEFTFKLRKGIKWSDGKPLTTADWVFWMENMIKNTTLTKAVPEYLTSTVEGKRVPVTLTAVDAFTMKFKFAKPNSLFHISGAIAVGAPMPPAHYMKQFHADFADKAVLDKAIADGSYKTWDVLFNDKNTVRFNVARPSHEPWIFNNTWKDELVTMRRNPYYWAVDKEGNQLPYIDKLSFRSYQDPQVFQLWLANGEIDRQARGLGFTNYTVLKENEKKGDYKVQLWRFPSAIAIHFNLTDKNPKLRELFGARDFRIAICYAINRKEMIDLLYSGMAKPMQYGPPKESPLYYEKLTNAYLDYDPKKANDMLDALGYSKKDADGFRLWKDGSGRVSFTMLSTVTAPSEENLMVIDYFKKVGLECIYKGVDRALSIQLHYSNDVDCTMGQVDRNLVPLSDPQGFIKNTNLEDRPWVNAWTAWKMDPKNPIAEEPPKGHWILKMWDLWDQIVATPDEKKQIDLFKQILQIWVDEMPCPGILGEVPQPVVVKNGFKGAHEGNLYGCCQTGYEHIVDNACYYWDDPAKHV